jgi:hypothetical protein
MQVDFYFKVDILFVLCDELTRLRICLIIRKKNATLINFLLYILHLSHNKSTYRVVPSQIILSLINFIEKYIIIYNTKLVSLATS